MRTNFFIALGVAAFGAVVCRGQSSSIAQRYPVRREAKVMTEAELRNEEIRRGNPTLEAQALTAVKVRPPKKFKLHDLVTVIIREQRKFESDAELRTNRRFELQSELDAFFKPINGTLGAATFRNGKPNVDYKYQNRVTNDSQNDREDSFTTRLTAEVIDIKPNGNLVLQARGRLEFDDEVATLTLTGHCRSTDVTPDNTVLSTQLADKNIVVENAGAVRDGSRRGWVTSILDWLRPI